MIQWNTGCSLVCSPRFPLISNHWPIFTNCSGQFPLRLVYIYIYIRIYSCPNIQLFVAHVNSNYSIIETTQWVFSSVIVLGSSREVKLLYCLIMCIVTAEGKVHASPFYTYYHDPQSQKQCLAGGLAVKIFEFLFPGVKCNIITCYNIIEY